jgi:hypothetical protein
VRVEALVLDRHGRLREEGRHLVQCDRLSVLLRGNRAEQRAVGRVDERVLTDRDGLERRERAAVKERLRPRERRRGKNAPAREDDRDQEDEDEAARLGPVAATSVAAAAAVAVVHRAEPVTVLAVSATVPVRAVAPVSGHV